MGCRNNDDIPHDHRSRETCCRSDINHLVIRSKESFVEMIFNCLSVNSLLFFHRASFLILSLWVVVLRDYGTYADLDGAGLRFLRCSPWECLEERCSRFDAFDCSSTLVSRLTRFQVSCEDSSPSSPHLSDERSVGDIAAVQGHRI